MVIVARAVSSVPGAHTIVDPFGPLACGWFCGCRFGTVGSDDGRSQPFGSGGSRPNSAVGIPDEVCGIGEVEDHSIGLNDVVAVDKLQWQLASQACMLNNFAAFSLGRWRAATGTGTAGVSV